MDVRLGTCISALLIAVSFLAETAHAQDRPHDGIAMGYPAAAGVLVNVGDRVALWPELLAIRHASTTNNGSPNDSSSVGAGVRVLLYLASPGAFRPYVAPQFDYTRSHSTQNGTPIAFETTVSSYGGAASFGAQYAVSERFGVFGEVGLEYEHEKGTGFIASHGNTAGTRNAVGVLVFF